jgi:cephalosporin-C deacetylase
MKWLSSLIQLLCGLIILLSATTSAPQPLTFEPFKPSGIYELGETVGWRVTAQADSSASDVYSYVIRKNNLEPLKSGTLDLSRPASIKVVLDEPAMVYVEIKSTQPDAKVIALGAAVSPDRLQPSVPEPADFDRFWARKIRDLQRVPARPVLTRKASEVDGVDYFTLRMNHVDGRHVQGQLAKPQGSGKFPGLIIFQWASPPYPLQKQWVTERAAQGWLTVNIEPHDVLPDAPQSYYEALPKELKEYSNIGRDDRDRNYFLQMYLADYRAVEYLASRPDWDGRTLIVMGTSMGGQQSLCAAALNPRVTGVITHMASGADSNGPARGRASGYPFWNADRPEILRTSLYFDTVNCAARIKVPTLVSMGFLDTVSPPVGLYIAFNRMKGFKEAVPLIDAPHNHLATPVQEAPFRLRAEQWLQALRTGQEVTATPAQSPN